MKQFYNFLTFLLFQFIFVFTAQSQIINPVYFNNTANYSAGSGVSVVINPTGVFDLNNQFILNLIKSNFYVYFIIYIKHIFVKAHIC